MTTGRLASVVLVHQGRVVGQLPPVPLEMPWWAEAHDLVAAVRERDGIGLTVLRLLHAPADRVTGGEVTYLAETDRIPTRQLAAVTGDPLAEHPLRQRWARPGGHAELLTWADERLAARGWARTGPAEQMRTWNLSALWRIPTERGRLWLKVVPDFFAHEGALIDWIGRPVAPEVVAWAPNRALIGDVAGELNHRVQDPDALRPMIVLLTALQRRSLDRLDELAALGVPDRRLPTMVPQIVATVDAWAGDLERAERTSVDALVAGLPARLAAVADCGVPDALVHGDFHSGNVAGRPGGYVLLDWGDSFLGHPLLDELAFVDRLPRPLRREVRGWFVDDWRAIAPGSDPARAAYLLEPVAALLAAVMYDRICAAIEPAERVGHTSELTRMLRDAARYDPRLL